MTKRLLPTLLPALLLATACQRIGEPTPTPTTDQWRRVQENLLAQPPTPEHEVGAEFDGAIRLLGWDVEPDTAGIGDEVALTFYWEVLRPVPDRWRIFVHLDSNTRQNLDHEAISNLYPTVYWKVGDVVRDTVTTTLETDVRPGDVRVMVGFFRDDQRMPVSAPGNATLQEDGRLDVGAFEARWEAPTYTIRRANGPVVIDGRAVDRTWSRAQRTGTWVEPSSGAEVEDMDTWAKMLWDDEFLYVLLNARDTDVWATLTDRDANLWDEEVLEFYFDGASNGRNYLELQVNPLNAVFDAVFARATQRDLDAASAVDIAGLETAVYVSGTVDDRSDRDRNWSAEIRIPLSSLPAFDPARAAAGDSVRVNFYRYDRPADGAVRTAAWSPVGPGTFHNPSRFGTATFEPPAEDGSGSGEAAAAPVRRNPAPTASPRGGE